MARPAAGKSEPQATGKLDARVDAKIAAAATTLQPVLNHIRELIHDTVPEVTETIKWGMPFFELNGVILANMGIFKQHCSLGFWSRTMTTYLKAKGVRAEGAGSLGRLTGMDDLPPYKTLVGYVREAAAQVKDGKWQSPFAPRTGRPARPEPAVPEDFAAALEQSPLAKEHFGNLAPSCRREYLEWIASAKRPETRVRRVATAVETIAQGKQHHWQSAKRQIAAKGGS